MALDQSALSELLDALRAGGDLDVVRQGCKDAPREQLFNAIRAAARGEAVLSPSVATRVLGRMRAPAEEALSPRKL